MSAKDLKMEDMKISGYTIDLWISDIQQKLLDFTLKEEEKRTLHNNYRYYMDYVPNNKYFPTETVEITKRIGWRTEIVKEQKMIPVTIEEIYKVMKPLFRNKFLANGREYEKVGYLNE